MKPGAVHQHAWLRRCLSVALLLVAGIGWAADEAKPAAAAPAPQPEPKAEVAPAPPAAPVAEAVAPPVPAAPVAKTAAEMLPAVSGTGTGGMSQVISLTLDDVPLAEVVKLFTRISGANIIAATSNLTGQVTANLQDVRWKPAFESILERQGLLLIEKPPASGIYVIDVRRPGEDVHVSETLCLNYAKVDEVTKILTTVLGKDGTVTPYPPGNSVIVNATAIRLAEVRKIIESVDRPRLQVYIETKIVQLSDGASKKLGIDWQGLDSYSLGLRPIGDPLNNTIFNHNVTKTDTRSINTTRTYDIYGNEVPILDHYESVITPGGTISVPIYKAASTVSDNPSTVDTMSRSLGAVLNADQFSVVLSALQGTTGAKVISNPKIIVANEEKALITIAQQEPNVRVTVTQPTVQGGTPVVSSELDGREPWFKYGTVVEVQPRVNTASNITVRIKPELTRHLVNQDKVIGTEASGGVNTYPVIDKKSVETIFNLGDGCTAAIGGFIETTEDTEESHIPLLGDIPWIGPRLFGHKSRVMNQQEVLIFVTVGLVDAQTATENTYLPKTTRLYLKPEKADAGK